MKAIKILVFLISINSLYSQNDFNYKKERNNFNINLIESGKRNQIIIKEMNEDEKFEGRYLGKIKTKLGNENYIVDFSYIFNLKRNPTAENFIFIFNSKKQYVGHYFLNQKNELPKKLIKNSLYFKNNDCENKTYLNFFYGIPRIINLKCNEQNNYYEFQS